jgi:predicted NBD/HSP70 family sugar kinase
MNSAKYIGLDVHQATISVAVVDDSGKVVMESVVHPSKLDSWGHV